MKNQIFLLLGLSIVGTLLFYQETPGLNLLVSGVIFSLLMAWRAPESLRQPRWWLASLAVVVSGIAAAVYGNYLSMIAQFISIAVLATITLHPRLSAFWGLITGGGSVILSTAILANRWSNAVNNPSKKPEEVTQEAKGPSTAAWLVLIGVPVLLALIFLGLYRNTNPAFRIVLDTFEFNLWSWEESLFTFLLFIGLFGLWFPYLGHRLSRLDRLADNRLHAKRYSGKSTFTFLNLQQESWLGMAILGLLNLLLLTVNLTDSVYWLGGRALPGGINYSDLVHEGVGTLIFSIVLAILILLFFFKGELNFYKKSTGLKLLAHTWLAQNLVLIGFTAVRNIEYISALGLTYKRIGVMVWLLLAVLGLGLMIWKLAGKRSTWFMVRRFSEALLFCLMLSTTVDWCNVVTRHNLELAKETNSPPDLQYLSKIGPANYQQLVAYAFEREKQNEANYVSQKYLQRMARDLNTQWTETGWASWSWRLNRNQQLIQLIKDRPIYSPVPPMAPFPYSDEL